MADVRSTHKKPRHGTRTRRRERPGPGARAAAGGGAGAAPRRARARPAGARSGELRRIAAIDRVT